MSTFTTHRGSLSLPLGRVATQNRERPITSLATTTPSSAPELVVQWRPHTTIPCGGSRLNGHQQTLRDARSRSVCSPRVVGGPFISRSIRRSSRAPFFSVCLSPPSAVVPAKARTYTRRTRAPATSESLFASSPSSRVHPALSLVVVITTGSPSRRWLDPLDDGSRFDTGLGRRGRSVETLAADDDGATPPA